MLQNNIFPAQQQPSNSRITTPMASNQNSISNNVYSRINQPYQSLLEINRRKLKTIQAQYFQNQYQNILSQKQRKKQIEKLQKQRDKQLIELKKQAYVEELNRNNNKKQIQKQYLSSDYQKTIDYQNSKNRYEKNLNKIIEKEVLSSPTWLRDMQSERQANIKKKMYYNNALSQHIRQQQQRKKTIQQSQQNFKQKIRRQAEQVRQKQIDQLQAKHRQKSMFQQRQNQLLGVGNNNQLNLQQSRTYFDKQRQLKQVQKELYRQGLQAQYEKQQNNRNNRKKAFSQQKKEFLPRYNPITNPIPYVYKNPNVLRMLNK